MFQKEQEVFLRKRIVSNLSLKYQFTIFEYDNRYLFFSTERLLVCYVKKRIISLVNMNVGRIISPRTGHLRFACFMTPESGRPDNHTEDF